MSPKITPRAILPALLFFMPSVAAAEGFESPVVGYGKFQYRAQGPWSFVGDAGISGNNSGFTRGNPPAPEGVQVGFVQRDGYCSRYVDGMAEGNYRLTFRAAQRGNFNHGGQDFAVIMDGARTIGTFKPAGTSYALYSTSPFVASVGTHSFTFRGLDTVGGDNTVFLDDFQVVLLPAMPYRVSRYALTLEPRRTQFASTGDMWPGGAWAADDAIYSSYGDGTGFGGTRQIGLGHVKLVGVPPGLTGTNIPSPTGETYGLGPTDMHCSSEVMVGGTLYMFVRNYIHDGHDGTRSTVALSTDLARSWTWVPWSLPMGYPVFLTFGRDYAGARDQYLYFYSPDTSSAYVQADTIIMGRVDRAWVQTASAYQYFAGLDANGAPTWNPDYAKRRAVFANPGKCYRPCVSYNPGIGRYLLATIGQTNHHLSVYDAPEPWGPWSTMYYSDEFAAADSPYCPQLPTKWMGADGLGGYLIYSSYPTNYRMNVQHWTLTPR